MKICGKLCRKVESYFSKLKAAIDSLWAKQFVRGTVKLCGVDADMLIPEAEELARTTAWSDVEALYLVTVESMRDT